jgi:hypothetical protein
MATQPQTTEPKDGLEMCKQRFNMFAVTARTFGYFGLSYFPAQN